MVKTVAADAKSDGVNGAGSELTSEYKGMGADHSMVFSVNALVSVDVPEVPIAPRAATPNGELYVPASFPAVLTMTVGVPSSFRTDTDISSATAAGRERSFQRWEAAPADKGDVNMSLDSAGDWDQFKANEEKFGLKSDYDENLYTTTIDRSNPLYTMREREAARIARQIEGDVSGNAHMREERGHKDDGADEEEK